MNPDTWLKELYDANYDRLYRLASNRLKLYIGHTSDVQDVLQDVFLEATRQNILNHPKPEAWLVVTTVNICKNYIRANMRSERKKRKYEQKERLKSKTGSLLFVASAKDETVVSDIKMTLEQILTPEEMQLVVKHYLNGQTLEEIGREMKTAPNTLRVRLFRIRKKISKNLDGM